MRLRRVLSFLGTDITCYTITRSQREVKRMNLPVLEARLASWIEGTPQIVPESVCLACKICCRFPDTEGVQTPTWSHEEAKRAKSQGPQGASWLEEIPGSPSLRPRLQSCGSGFKCPAFHPESNRCSIYEVRPLDCRLYPFVLTQDPSGEKLFLAMDLKCPYLQAHADSQEVSEYAHALVRHLEDPLGLEYLRANPHLVGPPFPEYVAVASLPRISEGARQPEGRPPHPALTRLTLADVDRLRQALGRQVHLYSGYTAAALLGWSDLIRFWWADVEGAFCLFAEQAGGYFMPLPPLDEAFNAEALQASWGILKELNEGSPVSRVEGLELPFVWPFQEAGFSCKRQDPEYLYLRADLVSLRGDRYRSKRWAANRCVRQYPCQLRPYQREDLVSCLKLYTRWAIERRLALEGSYPKALLRDGLFFHRRLMMNPQELGLTGWIVEVEGRLAGYTFGTEVSKDAFVVLLEVVDRCFKGLSTLLFREFCRSLGHRFINAMGDCGLERLARNKLSYRPCGMVWSGVGVSGQAQTEIETCS